MDDAESVLPFASKDEEIVKIQLQVIWNTQSKDRNLSNRSKGNPKHYKRITLRMSKHNNIYGQDIRS